MGMSSKKTLAEFGMLPPSVPTDRRRRMDAFMRVGNKMYGTVNTANDSITNYGGNTYSRKSPLNTEEYFGSIKANKGANIDVEKFKETIRQAEGLSLEPYKDKDKDSVGYGHLLIDGRTGNISVDRINKEDAEKLLEKDIEVRLKEVNSLLPNFVNFPKDAQQAIFSEYYRGSIGQSPVTRALINTGRYKEAAKEFLNNNEYKNADKNKMGGIKKRMEAVSKALIKMAKEKKESSEEKEITLPIKKPSKEDMDRLGFRYGGGADSGAGASGMGSAGRGRGGARDGGNPGGNNRDKSNNSKQGQTPGGPGKGRTTTNPNNNNNNNNNNNPTFGPATPTFDTPKYSPPEKERSLFSKVDNGWGLNDEGFGYTTEGGTQIGIDATSLSSVKAGISFSFEKGGLLDRNHKKK